MSVDEFIARKVQPELRETVERIRQTLRELAPSAEEVISYGIPAYRVQRIIAVISPTKKDITLAFSRGAEMEDRYGLLKGVGKVSKNLKFKKAEDVQKDVLEYYVRQALELDAK
jgi:uncharacterized protein YdhG (YjbR/CyaY superfamily)